jgi:hypothetical protein
MILDNVTHVGSVSFRVVIPGGPVGSPEGRTPNDVDGKFLATFFFTNFLLFLRPRPLTQTQPQLLLSDRRAISSIGSRATPKKKFFSQISLEA